MKPLGAGGPEIFSSTPPRAHRRVPALPAGSRVLFVTRSIPLHRGSGGMERVTWDLARTMAEQHEVRLLTTPVPGQPAEFESDGITVSTVGGAKSGRYSMRWWIETLRYSEAKRFDVVVSVSAAATAMVHAQRGPFYSFQAHGTALREMQGVLRLRPAKWPLKALRYFYWLGVDSVTYRRVDEVVATSEQAAQSLRGRLYRGAWKRTSLRVVPNAVDVRHFTFEEGSRTARRDAIGVPADVRVVMTVSRLAHQKGVDRVLDALALGDPEVHHVVCGTGPEERQLRNQAAQLGIAGRVHFVGQLNHDEVRDALHAADVFVFPVRNFKREGLPIAILEALAAGLPVLVPTDSTWPDDLATELRVSGMEPQELAYSIADEPARTDRSSRLPSRYTFDDWAGVPGWRAR